jgi:hypothetical protein
VKFEQNKRKITELQKKEQEISENMRKFVRVVEEKKNLVVIDNLQSIMENLRIVVSDRMLSKDPLDQIKKILPEMQSQGFDIQKIEQDLHLLDTKINVSIKAYENYSEGNQHLENCKISYELIYTRRFRTGNTFQNLKDQVDKEGVQLPQDRSEVTLLLEEHLNKYKEFDEKMKELQDSSKRQNSISLEEKEVRDCLNKVVNCLDEATLSILRYTSTYQKLYDQAQQRALGGLNDFEITFQKEIQRQADPEKWAMDGNTRSQKMNELDEAITPLLEALIGPKKYKKEKQVDRIRKAENIHQIIALKKINRGDILELQNTHKTLQEKISHLFEARRYALKNPEEQPKILTIDAIALGGLKSIREYWNTLHDDVRDCKVPIVSTF